VAVRVVAGDAFLEPNGLTDAEKIDKVLFQFLAPQTGIASLHRLAEQAFFGGQQKTPAIDIDAAAFKHDPGIEGSHLQPFCKKCRHPVVVTPIIVFRPAVENPICDADVALRTAHKDRAIIARPASIGAMAKELDGVHVRTTFCENAPRAFFHRGIFHQNPDLLHSRQALDNVAINPGNRCELPRPIGAFMRPRQPSGFVRLPLGRHSEPEFLGRQSSHRRRMGA